MQAEKTGVTGQILGAVSLSLGALSIGAITAIAWVVASTIAPELSHGFKEVLVTMTGHHWVTKGLLALGAFIVATLVAEPFVRRSRLDARFWSLLTSAVALLGVVVIFFFFIGHFVSE